jgi:predicted esterase YcpF (UPF0227 family)/prolyl-tRNA editing enzyme YbaK/EbsC (Cys-tRNA(Pro) deacylase)
MLFMILYLHGFRSSPQSTKARMLAEACAARGLQFACPQLPASPKASAAIMQQLVAGKDPAQVCLIGSSLGGYYANWLAEKIGCRAVLLNPAVHAARDLATQVGVTTAYHSNDPFEFKAEYIDELRALEVANITQPQRYFLIAAKGDEVLDWREMTAHYDHARHKLLEGSDHGLSDFADYIDEVLAFCMPPAAAASLAPSAQKVQQSLDALGIAARVIELHTPGRTAQQAADALGIALGQIAKSLVFRGEHSGTAVLVICAGDRRVDESKVAALLHEPVGRASPEFVREHSGYAIGGIPPVGHAKPMRTWIDESLARFSVVWAAGGTPHAVFGVEPQQLFRLPAVQVGDVTATQQ